MPGIFNLRFVCWTQSSRVDLKQGLLSVAPVFRESPKSPKNPKAETGPLYGRWMRFKTFSREAALDGKIA